MLPRDGGQRHDALEWECEPARKKEGAFLAVLCSLPHSTALWWKEGKGTVTLDLQLQTFFAGTSE